MKLTSKLMGYLYRPIKNDPKAVFAIALNYSADMTWTVADAVLTTVVPSNHTKNLTYDLTQYTLSGLCAAINTHAGYTAVLQSGVDGSLGAITLLDDSRDPDNDSNGNQLSIYTSLAWAYQDAMAKLLTDAKNAIAQMLIQMRIDQASGEWSDVWQQNTIQDPRQSGETDQQLDQRIISTMLTLRCNNVALQNIVQQVVGISVQIVDINWYVGTEAMFTFGGRNWDASQVTNSAHSRIYPAYAADGTVLAEFGLRQLPSGAPAYGPVSNNNALVVAFAVIFPANATCAQFNKVMPLIERNRLGGSMPLAFKPSSPLLTNVSADHTNDSHYSSGPIGTEYVPFTC